MKILFSTPEVYPFSKIGGVADFSESLPKAISKFNTSVYVISPYYQIVKDNYGQQMKFVGEKNIVLGEETLVAKYYSTNFEGLNYFFVAHEFFDRKYFFNHHDDINRFMFFNLAILELLNLINFYPDIIHVNDWTTSLVPYFLTTHYNKYESYQNIKTLLTIHNLEKQGAFKKENEYLFKFKNFTYLHLNNINFLKTGIMRANKINTVSSAYKTEILTKFFGFSLDGALKSRQLDLLGIQNGIDYDKYNPLTDVNLYFNYDEKNVTQAKQKNKLALMTEYNLKDPSKMLVTFVGRFAKEKGVGLIIDVIEDFLKDNLINFIIIGEGDLQFEMFAEELSQKYPNNFKYFAGHNFNISQKIIAASDLLLHPSLYEASGLNQMIAMRYGTVPLVRETGGLKDTVTNINEETNEGTGFTFENFDDEEFKSAIERALNIYNNNQPLWKIIVQNGMKKNNSIDKMAQSYYELYKLMTKEENNS